MYGLSRSLAIIVLGGAVAACGTSSDIAGMKVKGGAYEAGLHKGYVKLADDEYLESDISDGNKFSDRARLAAMGQPTGPEALDARKLNTGHRGDLGAARGRLVAAMGGFAMGRMPSDVAEAQVMFDCWMQEAEENLQPEDIAACRKGFETAMARIDSAKPAKVVMKAPPPAQEPQTRNFVVYFPLNSDQVAGKYANVVRDAAAFAKAKKASNIYVAGHADRAGPNKYNMKLADRRTKAVTASLTGLGVQKARLGTLVQGENDPAVATRDGVTEPRNRRVVISVVY